ncbi:putative F-box protein At3g58950 [Ricinus communis]|uniref:putative F-box protein At3g58950 n=1 Tax=Ricinus communis TaxID=3988 RepID=UPI0007726A0E|nr:putative F-box protein At3g58950 [Ricinus communis]
MDIISSLPNVVLCHVLSFLPTKKAVATSILSRRWRYGRISVPNLDFEDFQKVEELNLQCYHYNQLPKCFLVVRRGLGLGLKILESIFLPNLRSLGLDDLNYFDSDCIEKIISFSPVFEELSFWWQLRVQSASLKSLKICKFGDNLDPNDHHYMVVIDAPKTRTSCAHRLCL